MGIGRKLMGISHLCGGVKALLEEEFDFSVNIKGLAGVLGRAGPVGVAGDSAGTLVVLLECGLVESHAGLDQESEVLGDPVLGAVA